MHGDIHQPRLSKLNSKLARHKLPRNVWTENTRTDFRPRSYIHHLRLLQSGECRPAYRERKRADTTGTVLVPRAGQFKC